MLITGTVTNVCCESTARDAMMRNFKTIMMTDGNAANTDEDHNAALNNFYLTFGDIMSTDFAIGCLTRNAQKGSPRRSRSLALDLARLADPISKPAEYAGRMPRHDRRRRGPVASGLRVRAPDVAP